MLIIAEKHVGLNAACWKWKEIQFHVHICGTIYFPYWSEHFLNQFCMHKMVINYSLKSALVAELLILLIWTASSCACTTSVHFISHTHMQKKNGSRRFFSSPMVCKFFLIHLITLLKTIELENMQKKTKDITYKYHMRKQMQWSSYSWIAFRILH